MFPRWQPFLFVKNSGLRLDELQRVDDFFLGVLSFRGYIELRILGKKSYQVASHEVASHEAASSLRVWLHSLFEMKCLLLNII